MIVLMLPNSLKKSPYTGAKIKLRALELSDLSSIMEHWNTYEVRIGLGKYVPESSTQREEWIKAQTQKASKGEGYTFAIETLETKSFLGTCSLSRINNVSKTAFLSVVILNPENHGKGYGTDAVRCLLEVAFRVLNLHRVELHVYSFMKEAIHVYEKVGFKHTGVRREASYIDGEYRDDLVMDILKREYAEITKKMP